MLMNQIGVIGSAGPEEYNYLKPQKNMYTAAEELGARLATENFIVVNGGKGGVMLSVSKGAKKNGGIVVAESAGIKRFSSNRYVDVEIVTGDLAFRGPSQLVAMCDALIVLGGGAGTLQEICVAYRLGKPMIFIEGYGGWVDKLLGQQYLDERRIIEFIRAKTPEDAMNKLKGLLK